MNPKANKPLSWAEMTVLSNKFNLDYATHRQTFCKPYGEKEYSRLEIFHLIEKHTQVLEQSLQADQNRLDYAEILMKRDFLPELRAAICLILVQHTNNLLYLNQLDPDAISALFAWEPLFPQFDKHGYFANRLNELFSDDNIFPQTTDENISIFYKKYLQLITTYNDYKFEGATYKKFNLDGWFMNWESIVGKF